MNEKAENKKRTRCQLMVSPEALAYLDEKGKIVGRGNRGGRSEALNRVVKFVSDFETCSAESLVKMALGRADGELKDRLRAFCDAEGIG